jgi:PAS domain S-box-containing protein
MSAMQRPARLLIVDDDQKILKLLRGITEDCGYCCSTAPSVQIARQQLDTSEFDLLITEIQMPGESGVGFIKFVKDTYPKMAVVIESVVNDLQAAKSILSMGIYGYLIKPFDRHQAMITINNALIRRELETKLEKRSNELEQTVSLRTRELSELVCELTVAKTKLTVNARHLQDQLLFMQTLLDAIPNPIYYKNAHGVYQGCNQAFEAFLGYSRDQIVGKTIHDVSPKKLADHYQQKDEALLRQPGRQSFEGLAQNADGSVRDILFNKATFQNSSGTIEGIVGVMVDISDRKQKECALRMSEEKNRSIVENIGMGVALISPQLKVLEINSKMQRWFPDIRLDGECFCYESFARPPRKSPCSNCPTRETLADGKVHEAVKQVNLADGKHDYKIIASAITDSDGKVIAAIELVNDITKDLVMERELQQSQKLASIGQLAAGVAHEINNPTGFVSSNLGSLKDYQRDIVHLLDLYRVLKDSVKSAGKSPGASQLFDQITKIDEFEEKIDLEYIRDDIIDLIDESKEGTERIKKIVEDLKHFAHPGQDKIQDTDINKELASTLNVVNNELKYKARVVKEFNPLPVIMANPQQLNQVFINILVNAAQSIEKMGDIRILTEVVDKYVQIRISDTGCGISEENLSKIFDPFFTTKGVGKGTGLGMNIAYNIIQKHKGDIRVQSRVGEGTTFIISLPVAYPETDGVKTDAMNGEQISESSCDHKTVMRA